MIEAILPCPDCNKKPILKRENWKWQIRCESCGYVLSRLIADTAISAWNNYVNETKSQKKLLSKIIIKKEYCGENIIDIEEDIYSAIIEANIPKDESNIEKGMFKLSLTWRSDNE